MRLDLRAAVLTVFAITGCHPAMETPETHIIHSGETALVLETGRATAVLATSREAVHELARAVGANDNAAVDRLIRAGRAFEVPNGTPVKVESEAYNERRVRVLEGREQDRAGWVPYEWLRARQPTRH